MRLSIRLQGLDSLKHRFNQLGQLTEIDSVLREQAEAIAEEARENLGQGKSERDGSLRSTVEVIEIGADPEPAFAAGTAHPAGRYVEFGTSRMRARPWLGPAWHAHLPALKEALRRLLEAAVRAGSR